MTESQRIPLPSGLPKQFSDGRPGFQRLHKFLEIPNTKAVEAVLAAVKDAVQHVPVAGLQGADRRRVRLLAFYEKPDLRRDLWRQMLDDLPPTASREQPVPSLEFIALQRHDAEFLERDVDTAAVQDALRDFPDLVESVGDAPDWQHPALAAWPALQRDIAVWNALPDDRRDATALALFAVAVLDDHRFLRWAARGVDSLHEEFSPLFNDQPEDAPPDDGHDVIRQWKEICNTVATTARTLGADPPRPELLPDLLRHVDELTHLRGSLTSLLDSVVPEQLLQRVDDILARLLEDGDSPISAWKDGIGEQWRSVYIPNSPDTSPDIESFRADVGRLEAELESALDDWRAARRHHARLDEQHQEIKRQADADDDPLKRLDAQDREPELAQELSTAATAVRSARDRIFLSVAPEGQKFDPRRDYAVDEASPHPESPGVESDSSPPSDAQASTENADERATRDAAEPASPIGRDPDQDAEPEVDEAPAPAADPTAEPDQDAKPEVDEAPAPATGSPAQPAESPADTPYTDTRPADPPADPSPASDYRPTSAIEGAVARAGRRPPRHRLPHRSTVRRAGVCRLPGAAGRRHRRVDAGARGAFAGQRAGAGPPPHPRTHRPGCAVARRTAATGARRRQPAAVQRHHAARALRAGHRRPVTTPRSEPLRYSETCIRPCHARCRSFRPPARDQTPRLHVAVQRDRHMAGPFDALAGRVRTWQAGADSKHNIYGPATRVWRDLIGGDGVLAKLMRLISDPDKSVRPDVEAIHEQISDQRTFNELVHRADRRGRKRNPTVGRALKQMWNDVQPAVHLSGQWLSLMDTRPDTAGFVSQRIDALHSDLKRVGRTAIETLDGAADTAANGNALAATLLYARNAVNELLQLLDRSATFTESSLDANVILSRDLLYIPDQEIDAAFSPVSTVVTRLLDRLLDTAAHADTMRAAFDARLGRGDLIGARLALGFLETEEDVDDVCKASLTRRVDDLRRTLRTDLQSTQKRLESAFCRGQLSADDRDGMAAGLAALRQAAEPLSSTLHLAEVEVLTGSSRRLRDIDEGIEASSRKSREMVRVRLRNVPDDQMDEAARSIVDRTITEGYVQTAHEQINRLERGESLEPPPPDDDPFSEFTSAVEAIETARKTTDPRAIVRSARARQRIAAVPFDELEEEDAQSAASLLDAWYRTARKRSVDTTGLQDLLKGLGFSVRTVSPQRSRSQAIVTTEPIADRAVCPSRQFGSEANGRYRVLLNTDRSAMDSIFRSIGIEIRDPTIVLHFGCLGAERDEIRKRATREHRLFLVVDESLVLFLAARASNRLSALFGCTLPYSAAQPYATTSGLVTAGVVLRPPARARHHHGSVRRLLHLRRTAARQDRSTPPGREGLWTRRPCSQVDRSQGQRDRPGARPLARDSART